MPLPRLVVGGSDKRCLGDGTNLHCDGLTERQSGREALARWQQSPMAFCRWRRRWRRRRHGRDRRWGGQCPLANTQRGHVEEANVAICCLPRLHRLANGAPDGVAVEELGHREGAAELCLFWYQTKQPILLIAHPGRQRPRDVCLSAVLRWRDGPPHNVRVSREHICGHLVADGPGGGARDGGQMEQET
eukprot:scaffold198869_cov27-Tisochrysis_lutea.AAC.2